MVFFCRISKHRLFQLVAVLTAYEFFLNSRFALGTFMSKGSAEALVLYNAFVFAMWNSFLP